MGRFIWANPPKTWQVVRLGDVARIMYGKALKAESRELTGSFKVYGSGGIIGMHDEFLHKGQSIIIGRKGNVGAIYYSEEPFWCIDTAFYLESIDNYINSEYLAYLLNHIDLNQLTIVVAVPGLNRQDLESVTISIPPLPEQLRIVEILKQAYEIRCQRQEFIKEAKRLSTALFNEMFGDSDPRLNRQWKVVELGDIAKIETGGTPSRTRAEFYNGSIPWIKSTELVDGRIYATEEMISETALKQSNAKIFPVGTVLLAMYGQGQTRGRTGLLEIAAACNQACAAVFPNEELLPSYLFIWLQCSYERIRALGRGGQQENLNLSIIRSLKIPKPPKDIQKRFYERLLIIEELISGLSNVVKQYDTLLNRIIMDSFNGELTKDWRETHRQELDAWLSEHTDIFPKRSITVTSTEFVPPERPVPARPARRWLMDQLSEVQTQVYKALQEWKGTLIPSEDLNRFLEEGPVEHLEDAHDHVLRALNQLAGMGFIYRMGIPNQAGEYVTAYRLIREDELTKDSDLNRLEVLS